MTKHSKCIGTKIKTNKYAKSKSCKKAQKDQGNGIKKGDSYYWWKFPYSRKQVSKTYPKQSQLTQSAYLGALYDISDEIGAFTCTSPEELSDFRDDIVSRLEELRDECEEKRSNMPEALQDAPTGELLQERYDTLDSAISELESISCYDYDEPDDDDVREELSDAVEYTPTEEEEADEDFDIDDKKKQLVDERDIEEYKEEKFQEWFDEKKGEMESVSFT